MEQITPSEWREQTSNPNNISTFLSEWLDTSRFPSRENRSATADCKNGTVTADKRSSAAESIDTGSGSAQPACDTLDSVANSNVVSRRSSGDESGHAEVSTAKPTVTDQPPHPPHTQGQRPADSTPPTPPPGGKGDDQAPPPPIPLPPARPLPVPIPIPRVPMPIPVPLPGPLPKVPKTEPIQPKPRYTLPERNNPFLPTDNPLKDAHIPLPLRESIQWWIEDLEDDRYSVREKAQRKLTECPHAIGPILERIKEIKGKPGFPEQRRQLPLILQDQDKARLEQLKTDLLSDDKNERTAAYKTILRAQGYDFIAERIVPEMRESLNAEKDPKRRADLQRALDYMNECGDGCELDRNCRISRVFHPGTSKEAFRLNYEGNSNNVASVVLSDRMFAKHFGGIAELRASNGWLDSLADRLTRGSNATDLTGPNGRISIGEFGVALSTDSGTRYVLFDWEEHRGVRQRTSR